MRYRPGAPSAAPGFFSVPSFFSHISRSSCLSVPVAVLFLGLVADPEETHAVWYGMLNTLCVFDFSALTDAEKETSAEKKHYFWFGEVGMAAVLAGMFAVPAGCWLAGKADVSLALPVLRWCSCRCLCSCRR